MRPFLTPAHGIACVTLALGIAMTPSTAFAQHAEHQSAGIGIPTAMKAEHDEIHQRLVRATKAPGQTGAAARALAQVLHPHFVREEEIALPPLGLLAPLAQGGFTPEMTAVLPMTDALRDELPRMLQEHVAIHAATERLAEVARSESNAEVADLAATLAAHAEAEEQLFYPAAVLVGEVVRARAAAQRH
jgi:hypothetical protein